MQIFDSPEMAFSALGHSVVTIGKYDGMHLGHQQILEMLLQRSKALGLPALVILSEPQPEEFFAPGQAPVRLNHFADKVAFLESFGIDAVLRLNFDRPLSQIDAETFVRDFLVSRLGLKALIVGDDFRFGRNRGGDFQLLSTLATELGYETFSIAPCHSVRERVSSTLIRQYLQQGDCNRVRELLGRSYSISGTVIYGRQLGRTLGVPTANVELVNNKVPMSGVFAVCVEHGGARYQGVANIGLKPTVSDDLVPSLEVHLFDFNQDVYGQTITVLFQAKLRDEKKFGSLDELKAQINTDIKQAQRYLEQAEQVDQSAVAQEAK